MGKNNHNEDVSFRQDLLENNKVIGAWIGSFSDGLSLVNYSNNLTLSYLFGKYLFPLKKSSRHYLAP